MAAVIRYVVPWRTDGGHRARLWAYCLGRWQAHGITPVESPSPEGRFNRGAAINWGVGHAGSDWEVVVVMDADVLAPAEQVSAAAERAALVGRLTFGFTRYLSLQARSTERILEGRLTSPPEQIRPRTRHESSLLAIPRNVWETVGGFDERFVGWGQDDVAFCQAVRVMTGEPERIPGDVVHLWHPLAREKNRSDKGWQANQALGRRYRQARTVEQMVELLDERDLERGTAVTTSADVR